MSLPKSDEYAPRVLKKEMCTGCSRLFFPEVSAVLQVVFLISLRTYNIINLILAALIRGNSELSQALVAHLRVLYYHFAALNPVEIEQLGWTTDRYLKLA